MNTTLTPARVPPPGRIIRREIEARGWTQKDLANIIERPEKTISEIVNARKQITPDTALQLAAAFGTSADLWLNLETNYQLHLARKHQDLNDIKRKRRLYEAVPLSEIIRRGWIKASDVLDELEQEVKNFLGVEYLEEQPTVAVSLRQSDAYTPELAAETAWVKRVEHLAHLQAVNGFDRDQLLADLPQLLDLASRVEDVSQVPGFLRSHGVHFLIVPHLQHTYIDGAAFVTGGHPVVALTLRHDRTDNFWFTLLHELAHLIAGHKGGYLDNLEEPAENPEELEANTWAQARLINDDAFSRFVTATHPYYSHAKVVSFAAQIHRHPGIVVGRLQHEVLIEYRNLRRLLVSVTPYLEQWIDVAEPG